MLMTNMTFKKRVGTPTSMAPEMLNKAKCKKGADVYSLGVTLFECLGWGDANQKQRFMFPWQISYFVQRGERLGRPMGCPTTCTVSSHSAGLKSQTRRLVFFLSK